MQTWIVQSSPIIGGFCFFFENVTKMFCASTCSFYFNFILILYDLRATEHSKFLRKPTSSENSVVGMQTKQVLFFFKLILHLIFICFFLLLIVMTMVPPHLLSKPASVCGSWTRRQLGEKRSFLISLVIMLYSFFFVSFCFFSRISATCSFLPFISYFLFLPMNGTYSIRGAAVSISVSVKH